MRKITINYSATTRQDFSEEIEISDNMSDDDIDILVEERRDSLDGSEYSEDSDYWEDNTPYWEESN